MAPVTASFKDHFSGHAAEYARFRPVYPAELYEYLARTSPGLEAAWDCATGNGQAAVALAERFARVVATDASSQQLAHAMPHPRVEYRLARAEESGLDDHGVDLVTVAQAVHWLDLEVFWAEVRRVARPGGLLAVWGYDRRISFDDPALGTAIERLYETVDPYWPPERGLLESGYRALPFPFAEISPPDFEMRAELDLDELAGYCRTWSAVRRLLRESGVDPVTGWVDEVRPRWGDPGRRRTARWPLALRVGRVTAEGGS